MKKVLFIEEQIKQYRAPFYAGLYEALRVEGIQLKVCYSDPSKSESLKKDTCDLPVEYGKKVKGYCIWRGRLLYQPLLSAALEADLVVVDQGNRFLLNHLLLPISRMGLHRLAFWGLGDNRQAGQIRLSEWYRRNTLNWVSWWFAYTEGTARYLAAHGVPGHKITAVQNSVDTHELHQYVKDVSPAERMLLRQKMGIPPAASVGVFCGMLDKVKSVPFLIDASRIVRQRVPSFHLILIGGGAEQHAIHKIVENEAWIHMAGPRFGREKAELLAVSDVFLLPGRVGLAVLDAFAAGLPLFTTRLSIHGPEFEYLENGVNGMISDVGIKPYAESVCSVLEQTSRLDRLRSRAAASSDKYSIEKMVANFKAGIEVCLSES